MVEVDFEVEVEVEVDFVVEVEFFLFYYRTNHPCPSKGESHRENSKISSKKDVKLFLLTPLIYDFTAHVNPYTYQT